MQVKKKKSNIIRKYNRQISPRFLAIFTILAVLLTSVPVRANSSVSVDARFRTAEGRHGEKTVLAVEIKVPKGFHLYSMTVIEDGPMPLKVDVDTGGVMHPVSDWYGPSPKVEMDTGFNKAVEYFSGNVLHERAFLLSEQSVGKKEIAVSIKGQICDDKKCVPFREKRNLTFSFEPGLTRPDRAALPELKGETYGPNRPAPNFNANDTDASNAPPLGEGFIGFILIAFLAGFGALVTPCVFPMIPITVSFFSKFAKVSLKRSILMASIYAVSIIATFTLAGVLISAIFGAVGMQTLSASAGFNLFLTVLLIVFAFNLFGLFEIQMPSWLVTSAGTKERALSQDGSAVRQAGGVFFMAVTFTLVSFTCTVGFIGIVLAEAAKGNWFYPAMGMAAFSTSFALPFFFLAVFPSWAEKLRGRGGDWMVAVKVTLGFLELASALKFLSNVDLIRSWGIITRPLALTLWSGIFGAAALYLLRVFNLPHSDIEEKKVGPIRMLFALLLLSLSVFSASGIRDTKSMGGWIDSWLPPAVYPGQEVQTQTDEESSLTWIVNDIKKGFTVAREQNRPLFIDFTGYTCTNCRYMEGSVFPKPAVKSRLKQMVLVSAYTDCAKDVCEQQREYQIKRFNTAALPLYVIIDPVTDKVTAIHPDMSKDIDEFIIFLDNGIASFNSASASRERNTEVSDKNVSNILPSDESTISDSDD